MKRETRVPLIVAITLVLLLYVGSYLAIIKPPDHQTISDWKHSSTGPNFLPNYRSGGQWESQVFWPLEQIDRAVRPGVWAEIDRVARMHRLADEYHRQNRAGPLLSP